MSWAVIITLIIVGILFLLLEVLVIPGATVAGILGFILIGAGVFFTYDSHGAVPGHIVVASSLILSVLTLVLALRSRTWKKAMLERSIDSHVNNIDPENIRVGDTGITVSRLAPSGKGFINGEHYEVHTQGGWIDPGQEIIVISIEGYKVIVKPKQ